MSTCLYLAALCVADLIVLITRCGNQWLFIITGYDVSWNLMIHYDIVCKSLPFAFNFTFHLSKWLVVATAIEGVIAVGFPQRFYFSSSVVECVLYISLAVTRHIGQTNLAVKPIGQKKRQKCVGLYVAIRFQSNFVIT